MATDDDWDDFPNWNRRLAIGFGVIVFAVVAMVRLVFGGPDGVPTMVQLAVSIGAEADGGAAEPDAVEVDADAAADELVDQDDPSPPTVDEAPAATAFVGEDVASLVPFDAAYCAALSDLWRTALTVVLGPAQGDWPSFADDMGALADSIDGVAAIAPDEHRDLLLAAGESYRALGAVPWEQARWSPLFTGDQTLGFPTDEYFEHVCMHRSDSYG